jgi:L-ascorbate metabolism protein UlaG (beta-lactamase superfamily)
MFEAMTRRKFILRGAAGLTLASLASAGGAACALQPKIGPLPQGQRLERFLASPNYVDGAFRNQLPTATLTSGKGQLATIWDFLFVPKERLRPDHPLPMLKTDLKALAAGNDDAVVWLGHSSLFLRLGGNTVLVDPVFSSYAAPLFFMNRAFDGVYPYSSPDIPDIDCLVISHDHWDHLDHDTVVALRPRIKAVVCPLGVGAILEDWGFDPARIHEADWNQDVRLAQDFTVHVLPARHFSGRWLTRNKTLWAGFLLETPCRKVFYSGDTGYGPHFAEIGQRFGGVDLAIMENGQYDPGWKNIHMMPEEAAKGAEDLRAKAVLPVHSGRFTISNHAWDDPYKRLAAASEGKAFRLLTPRIGEVADLGGQAQRFATWWEAEVRMADNTMVQTVAR